MIKSENTTIMREIAVPSCQVRSILFVIIQIFIFSQAFFILFSSTFTYYNIQLFFFSLTTHFRSRDIGNTDE